MSAKLNALRREIIAWEREQFGPPVITPVPAGAKAPPGNWPRMPITTWTAADKVRAAVSPDCSFRLLRDAIAAAKKSLDVYIYNIQSDRIVELLRARKPGVKLRVMYDVTDPNAMKKEEAELATLSNFTKKPAPSAAARRIFTVCHQKYVVIDNQSVVLGSANWAESSIPYLPQPGKFKKGNREWLVHLKSADIARWFTALFDADWNIPPTRGMPRPLALDKTPPVMVPARAPGAPTPVDVFEVDGSSGVKIRPVISPQNYYADVLDLIQNAQKSICIQQQYILAGGKEVEGLIQAVADKAKDLDVQIMVSPTYPKNWDRSKQTLEAFKLGKKLRALNLAHYIHLHNKGVIVDDKHAVISSTNWSQNSIANAREAGVIVSHPKVVKFFRDAFDQDWKNGWKPDEVGTRTRELVRAVPPLEPGGFIAVPTSDLVA